MWSEFEKEKEKFRQEHPDKARKEDELEEYAKYFEDATARELRLIYEAQDGVHKVLQQIDAKMQNIINQQSQHTPLLQQGRPNIVQLCAHCCS